MKGVLDLVVYNQQILDFTPRATDVMIPQLREQKVILPQKMIL